METKNKIVKTAKVCGIIAKVLYLLSFAVCLTFIILAIVLPSKGGAGSTTSLLPSSLAPIEIKMMFITLAMYSFIAIGLLWNVEGIFTAIIEELSPFTERVGHYIKKVAIFVIALEVAPAILGSTILRIIYPATELVFPIELGGVLTGAVLFLIGLFINYGIELQKRDDETL